MPKIKTKDIIKGTIKTLDKGAIATERTKDVLVNIKEKAENSTNSEINANEYGSDKINFVSNRTADETIYHFNKKGKESIVQTKDNFIKTKIKIKNIKSKLAEKRKLDKVKKTKIKGIKTANKTVKTTVKTTKESIKAVSRAKKFAQETAKSTYRGIKLAFKTTISAIKGIIAGTKALIAALIAGGWIALVVILIICMIGLLCSSIFGIFFSSEKTGSGITMNQAIIDINKEMSDKIKNIQDTNIYDDYVIDSDRAEWKDILAIYTAKISNGSNEAEVISLDDNKVKTLKEIFWKMNEVTYEVKEERSKEGFEVEEIRKVLYITISSESVDELMQSYYFTPIQQNQVKELLNNKYATMWSSVIFGTSVGSPDIVQIALSQVGNVGGQPYWSWYGFSKRVEWCAVFVSWVANQAGYIQTGVIPKFAGCETGINFFKAIGQWKEAGYTPKGGDIIFFDWESDGSVSHVGIVEKVENGRVYTVEGNSTDDGCRQKNYSIDSKVIFGYGTPQY